MSSSLFVSDGARQTLGRLLKKNYLKTNQLGFEVFDEAIIMPVTFSKEISSQFWGGVLSKDYQFIASTNFNEEQTESDHFGHSDAVSRLRTCRLQSSEDFRCGKCDTHTEKRAAGGADPRK